MNKPDNIELRNWFAGMALQGSIISNGLFPPEYDKKNAARAYQLADAMIEEAEQAVKEALK